MEGKEEPNLGPTRSHDGPPLDPELRRETDAIIGRPNGLDRSESDQFYDRFRAEGRVVSKGRFSIDVAEADRKILVQLEHPEGAFSDPVFNHVYKALDPLLEELAVARQSVTEEFSTDPAERQAEAERRAKMLEHMSSDPHVGAWADALALLVPRLHRHLEDCRKRLPAKKEWQKAQADDFPEVMIRRMEALSGKEQEILVPVIQRGLWLANAAESLDEFRTHTIHESWQMVLDKFRGRVQDAPTYIGEVLKTVSVVQERRPNPHICQAILKLAIHHRSLDRFIIGRAVMPTLEWYKQRPLRTTGEALVDSMLIRQVSVLPEVEAMLLKPELNGPEQEFSVQTPLIGIPVSTLKGTVGRLTLGQIDQLRSELGLQWCAETDLPYLIVAGSLPAVDRGKVHAVTQETRDGRSERHFRSINYQYHVPKNEFGRASYIHEEEIAETVEFDSDCIFLFRVPERERGWPFEKLSPERIGESLQRQEEAYLRVGFLQQRDVTGTFLKKRDGVAGFEFKGRWEPYPTLKEVKRYLTDDPEFVQLLQKKELRFPQLEVRVTPFRPLPKMLDLLDEEIRLAGGWARHQPEGSMGSVFKLLNDTDPETGTPRGVYHSDIDWQSERYQFLLRGYLVEVTVPDQQVPYRVPGDAATDVAFGGRKALSLGLASDQYRRELVFEPTYRGEATLLPQSYLGMNAERLVRFYRTKSDHQRIDYRECGRHMLDTETATSFIECLTSSGHPMVLRWRLVEKPQLDMTKSERICPTLPRPSLRKSIRNQ